MHCVIFPGAQQQKQAAAPSYTPITTGNTDTQHALCGYIRILNINVQYFQFTVNLSGFKSIIAELLYFLNLKCLWMRIQLSRLLLHLSNRLKIAFLNPCPNLWNGWAYYSAYQRNFTNEVESLELAISGSTESQGSLKEGGEREGHATWRRNGPLSQGVGAASRS